MLKRNILHENYGPDGLLKSVIIIKSKKEDDKLNSNYYYTYVPKWCLYLSCILAIAALIFFIATFAVVFCASRHSLYNETCDQRSCMKDLNLKCINKTCICADNQYYTNKCVPKKTYLEKCHLSSQCKDNTNMVCLDGKCKCNETQYWNSNTCKNKSTLGEKCGNDEQCYYHSILNCDGGKCQCNNERFWDKNACILKRTLNELCFNDTQCIDTRNLKCISGKCQCVNQSQYWDWSLNRCLNKTYENKTCLTTAQCYSPMTCTALTMCQCADKQYHNITSLTCVPQKTINESCLIDFHCRVDKYLECNNSICQCILPYIWSNGFDKCIMPSIYNETCFVDSDCYTSIGLICNSGSNNCSCPITMPINNCDCLRQTYNENYWNGSSCESSLTYSQPCKNTYMCKTMTEGTSCSGGSCVCPSLQYFNLTSSKCTNQLFSNQPCPQGDECRVDLGLSCQSGLCLCDSSFQFWNGTKCINYYTYGDSCSGNGQCKSILYCTSGTSCLCPTSLLSGKCDCPARTSTSEYYWNGTSCTPSLAYGESCSNASASYMCKTISQNTICSGSGSVFSCSCANLQYYNTVSNLCVNKILNNESCPQGNECRTDLGLSCQSSVCVCNTTFQFWTGSVCANYYTYNNETCSNDDQCNGILVCKTGGTSCNCPTAISINKCDCPERTTTSEYYWNANTCVYSGVYGQSCTSGSTNFMCRTLSQNTICRGSGSIFNCTCANFHYFNTINSSCMAQVLVNQSCPQGDECRTDLGLQCRSGTCVCNSTIQFWSGSQCVNYYTYNNEICTSTSQCAATLVCKTSGSSCDCPFTVINGKCDCPLPVIGAEYYWNGNQCVLAANHNAPCAGNYACKNLEQNTVCTSSTCQCQSTYTYLNGKCRSCNAGWSLRGDKCFKTSSNTVQQSTFNSSTNDIKSACGEPLSKLASISAALFSSLGSFVQNANDEYWIDGYVIGGVFRSVDSSVIYSTNLCGGSGDCIKTEKAGGSYCFKRQGCSSNEKVFCEYPPQ